MKVVRTGVFETNSSSCHSICICRKRDYESGESFMFHDKLYTKDSLMKSISNWLNDNQMPEEIRDIYKNVDKRIDTIWDAYKEFETEIEDLALHNELDWFSKHYKHSIKYTLELLQDDILNFNDYIKDNNCFKKYYKLSEIDKSVCSDLYENVKSLEDWFEDESELFETYEEYYTSDSGDEIVVFGYYGNDQ